MKLYLFLLIPFFLSAQNNSVFSIEIKPDKTITYKTNLSEGYYLKDLSWAWDSANACFPETQKEKFNGKHIFFTGIIPDYTETTITVIPKDKTKNFSVYAYQIGANEDYLVPNLPRCVTCEADYKQDYKRLNKPRQNHTRTVSNLLALRNSYRIVIGVTGANGLSEGDFILKVVTKKL